jgi:hypothetical protein
VVGRKVDVDDLLDASAVADLLGLTSQNAVAVYRARYPGFPPPALEAASGRCKFWIRQDVEEWSRDRKGRQPR